MPGQGKATGSGGGAGEGMGTGGGFSVAAIQKGEGGTACGQAEQLGATNTHIPV